MNHFNKNSMTREQFKSHSCYIEQKKIDESLKNPENISKIKMLLLQKCEPLIQKARNGNNQAKEFQN